jgi:hypothetical protein
VVQQLVEAGFNNIKQINVVKQAPPVAGRPINASRSYERS